MLVESRCGAAQAISSAEHSVTIHSKHTQGRREFGKLLTATAEPFGDRIYFSRGRQIKDWCGENRAARVSWHVRDNESAPIVDFYDVGAQHGMSATALEIAARQLGGNPKHTVVAMLHDVRAARSFIYRLSRLILGHGDDNKVVIETPNFDPVTPTVAELSVHVDEMLETSVTNRIKAFERVREDKKLLSQVTEASNKVKSQHNTISENAVQLDEAGRGIRLELKKLESCSSSLEEVKRLTREAPPPLPTLREHSLPLRIALCLGDPKVSSWGDTRNTHTAALAHEGHHQPKTIDTLMGVVNLFIRRLASSSTA